MSALIALFLLGLCVSIIIIGFALIVAIITFFETSERDKREHDQFNDW